MQLPDLQLRAIKSAAPILINHRTKAVLLIHKGEGNRNNKGSYLGKEEEEKEKKEEKEEAKEDTWTTYIIYEEEKNLYESSYVLGSPNAALLQSV